MPIVTADIPVSIKVALDKEIARVGGDQSAAITAALAEYLGTPVHTLFQVSTSGALVAGVSAGVVSVKTILDHGDFGLGTFADLDGEMVVLDGRAYQVPGSGRVSQTPPGARAPFAVVTRFSPQIDVEVGPFAAFAALQARCDSFETRATSSMPFALTAAFLAFAPGQSIRLRKGAHLVDAAKSQSKFNSATSTARWLVSGLPGSPAPLVLLDTISTPFPRTASTADIFSTALQGSCS